MKYLKKYMHIVLPLLRNKYVIAGLVFIIWIGFFDQNNIVDRVSLARRISELNKQKEHYQNEIKSNRERMDELQSSHENLEKFAREQYLMKKPDEELFIIKEK
ncbi:septum formation initiator [Alkalitalea saponilacus]|uniref:Cell division protein FtsB n=2 Tax=Alkalitalea saponilacus TaxID=889453 RepID=A0A1T5BPW2_9BACT|nr:septum formation initiator [Alkalitalea saponilacus]SKB49217.1 Cell division protein FtsB [Alkalitalea saponilacus]